MSSTLALHNPKYNAKLTPYAAIASLPAPIALGAHHKPVPHVRLIDSLREEITRRGYAIDRESFALGETGAALFGVMDLATTSAHPVQGRCMSLGFRNSTDMTMAIRAVAGTTVFVCDNMALSGAEFAIQRKNTTGLDLGEAVVRGFDRFLQHSATLTLDIARLESAQVADGDAKILIYDALRAEVIPSRLFDDVDRFYFDPVKSLAPECEPRTAWGLHNAFTRAMKDLTPTRRFSASVSLGKLFGLGVAPPAWPDGGAVPYRPDVDVPAGSAHVD